MRISIRVKPASRRPGIELAADGVYVVRVKEPPIDGKANKAVLRAVAEALGAAPSAVQLVAGESAKTKRLEIPDVADWQERLASAN